MSGVRPSSAIIGSGPEKRRLQQLAKKLEVADAITWKQNLSRIQLLRIFKSSHLFSLPSLTEGFGLVTLEALAAGTPYVNADIAVNREITRSSKGGLLFKPGDPKDLAQKIIRLITEPALYNYKLKQAKELLKHYSWKKSARETLRIYQSVIR